MSAARLILLGTAVFIIALLATLPAPRLLAPLQTPGLQFFGIEGNLTSGHVHGITSRNRPLLENLSWQLSPLQLLMVKLGYEITGEAAGANPGEVFAARISLSPLGRWTVRDFKGVLSLQSLGTMAGQTYLPLEGQAQLDLGELSWKQDQSLTAQGSLRLADLRWTLAQTPLPLGDYEAVITPEGDDLDVKINALSGPLEVLGEARYKADRSYELHLQLRPKTGADPVLQNLLRTLGNPDHQAWYHLRRNGKF